MQEYLSFRSVAWFSCLADNFLHVATNKQDVVIGRNLSKIRQKMECTQEELANEMRSKYGYKWSRATVWSIETGERPLKLTEAQDALKCLVGPQWVAYMQILLQGEGKAATEIEIKANVLGKRFDAVEDMLPELANAYLDFLLAAASNDDDSIKEKSQALLDDCGPESLNSEYWEYLKDRLREYCGENADVEQRLPSNNAKPGIRPSQEGYQAEWRSVFNLLGDEWTKYLSPDEYYQDNDGE